MNKKISLLLCGALALTLAGCSSGADAEPMDTTVTVEVLPVHTGTLTSESTYIGTVSAEGTATVIAQVSGTVEYVSAAVGDTVSAGDILCRFDDESAQASYQSALASVSSARASLESAQASYQSSLAGYGGDGDSLSILEEQLRSAETNYDNMQTLFEAGLIPQTDVTQAYQNLLSAQASLESARLGLSASQASIHQAQASVENAETSVASARYQLSLYSLTAPISGVVEAVNVSEHNYASSGTVAFVISNAKNKTVTFYVTDDVRRSLLPGQPVTVSSRHDTYSGVISEISGVVDSSTGLFQAKALIDGAQNLPDGLTIELKTISSRAEDTILIPTDALYFDNGEAYVYLAREGAAWRTPVGLSLYTTEQAAIVSGLALRDEIIISWSSALKDNAPIRIVSENSVVASPAEQEDNP